MPSLHVWMNGELVGEWSTPRHGTALFRYAEPWTTSARSRALSLSLPITADLIVRGNAVDNYFDNLLPDNSDIRRRIRARFGTKSTDAFDLLEAIGRDCTGAVQLLPPDQEPLGWNKIEAEPLSDKDLERLLGNVAAPPPLGRRDSEHQHDDDFRISIAGAQEKTALLSMGGAWYRPQGATPTTHILKLPLGIVGNFRGEFSDSVENEWLCGQIMQAFGLPTAHSSILKAGAQTVLAVERFDRRWVGVHHTQVSRTGFTPPPRTWIARLPQEDLCQATGRPATQKYEAEGGPSADDILELLTGSENADTDRANFVLTQLAFWLLAAIDGHAKNFSLYQGPHGAFGMTPLYDVLSAWPIIGPGAYQLSIHDAKLAIAIRGKNRHYKLREIYPRHWHAVAERAGLPGLWEKMRQLVATADLRIATVREKLPPGFPQKVIDSVAGGVRAQTASFLGES